MGLIFWFLFQLDKLILKRQGWVMQRDSNIPVNFRETSYILKNPKRFDSGEIKFTIATGTDAWKTAIVYGIIPTSTVLKNLTAIRDKYHKP